MYHESVCCVRIVHICTVQSTKCVLVTLPPFSTDRVLKELALQHKHSLFIYIATLSADSIFMRKLWARTYLFVIIIVFVEIYVSCLLAYKYISIANDMYNLIYLPNIV